MNIRMIQRFKDVITGKEDLELLYTMTGFPIYMGVTDQSESEDVFADEKWMISKESGMIQLGEMVPLDILYAKSHNSGIGKVWQRHNEKFADFIYRNKGKEGIVEIGGGNGILNAAYSEKYGKTNWTIIEPSSVEALSGCTANYIRAFWDYDINYGDLSYDTLVHAHCMEHQFDVNKFMEINAGSLTVGGVMLFSLPNMKELLLRRYPYALNFEHTYLITEDYVELILKKYGFEILEKDYFEDHSIFYSTQKTGYIEEYDRRAFKGLYDSNKGLFMRYIEHYKASVERLNNEIESYEGGNIFIFGAHINTQLLMNFGLSTERVECTLDNDEKKQGYRLYGTKLCVKSPIILAAEERPMVLLVMGAYNNEIKEDIVNHINENVKFVYL